MRSMAQATSRCRSQAARKPSRPCSATTRAECRFVLVRTGGAERQRHIATAPSSTGGCRAGRGVQSRFGVARALSRSACYRGLSAIDGGDLRLHCTFVWEQKPGLAAFDYRRSDGAAVDVGQGSAWRDHGGVLLAQGLQPFAELAGEPVIIKRQPALVDQQVGDPSRRSPIRWNR